MLIAGRDDLKLDVVAYFYRSPVIILRSNDLQE